MRLFLLAVRLGSDPFLRITSLFFMSRHVRRPDVFRFIEPDPGPKCLKIISGLCFFYITFNENIIVSNSLVPDQSRCFVGHDLKKNIRYFSFDHIAHRRAGRSSVLESSCTKLLGLRSGPTYQWVQ